jgi:hypothetical protein
VYRLRFLGVAAAGALVLAGGHSHAAQSSTKPAHLAHHVARVKSAAVHFSQPTNGGSTAGYMRYVPQPNQHITAAPGVKDTTHM